MTTVPGAEELLAGYLELRAQTESPACFHRWSFLSCCAAMLSRNIWFQWGKKKVYPVMYTVLVGSPGTRKSSAIKPARDMLRDAGYSRMATDRTSKAGFVQALAAVETFDEALNAGPDHVDEMFVVNDELLDFLGENNKDFTTFLTKIWDPQDKHEESYKKAGDTVITNPTVNILGGMTVHGLQLGFPSDMQGTGFLSRVLLIYSEPSTTRITFPEEVGEEAEVPFIAALQRMRELRGQVRLTDDAKRLLDSIYQNFSPIPDVRLTYYCARRLEHLLRLCVLLAGMGDSLQITADIVIHANTLLTAAEDHMPRAFGEYGKSKVSDATNAVMAVLEANNRPMSADELYQAVSSNLDSYTDLFRVLQNLARADRIMHVNQMFVAKQRSRADRRLHTDFVRYIKESAYHDKYLQAQAELEQRIRSGSVRGDTGGALSNATVQ